MAISPILAQAILNQRPPDIVGSFERAYEKGRERRIEGLAGAALRGEEGKFKELQGVAPEVALQVGAQMRAQSAADIEDFVGGARFLRATLASGNIDQARGFLQDRLQRLESRGADTTQTAGILQRLDQNPNEAFAEVQKFLNVWDGSKEGERAKVQAVDPTKDIIDPYTGEVIRKGAAPTVEDTEGQAIRKEVRSSVGQQLKGVNQAASEIRTNLSKVQNLATQIDKGNRSAVPAAVVALVKLGDPGSVVSQAEIETALNKQNPLAALAATLRGKGVDDEVITSLEQRLDPLDPLNIKTPELLATAQALVSANIPSIVESYRGARESADQNLTEAGIRSLFTEGLDKKIRDLEGLIQPTQGANSTSEPENAPKRLKYNPQTGRLE